MLDFTYHMTNTLKSDFWRKNVIILSLCAQNCYGRHNVSCKSINHLSILMHNVISLPDATSYDKQTTTIEPVFTLRYNLALVNNEDFYQSAHQRKFSVFHLEKVWSFIDPDKEILLA